VPGEETLRPVAWTFGAFGAFWGTWAVAAVDAERRLHLSDGGLGLLLSVSVVAGGVVAAAFGAATHRIGTARALATALGAWAACLLGAAVVPSRAGFFVLFVATMIVAGTVDAAMNTAVAIGARGDGATMVRFHALFNAGALFGAALTGVLLGAGATWRVSWALVAVTGLVLAFVCARSPLPGSTPAVEVTQPVGGGTETGMVRTGDSGPGGSSTADTGRFGWRAVRSAHLSVLAGVFFGTALVEGGIDTWGVLYLRTHLHAAALLGAGAYALGQAVAVTVRVSSARHVGRIGARAGLVTGATVAAVGLALEASASVAAVAGIGLLVAIGGIALCWPLVMALVSGASPAPGAVAGGGASATAPAGTGAASATVAALVGAFTAVGYLGWVAGPGIVGWVADTWSLGAGLALLAAVAAGAAGLLLASPTTARAR
jgi:hypothetical protein